MRLEISFTPGRMKTVFVIDTENKRSGHNRERCLGFLSTLGTKCKVLNVKRRLKDIWFHKVSLTNEKHLLDTTRDAKCSTYFLNFLGPVHKENKPSIMKFI